MKPIEIIYLKSINKMKDRICPDCKSRQLEKYATYCSECAFDRRQQTMEIGVHKYLLKNRTLHNTKVLKAHHDNFKSRAYYRELARC